MLVVDCPEVPSGRRLVSERRIAALTDDGAGTITLVVVCPGGHLHEVVTGRAVTDGARRLPDVAPEPVAVAC